MTLKRKWLGTGDLVQFRFLTAAACCCQVRCLRKMVPAGSLSICSYSFVRTGRFPVLYLTSSLGRLAKTVQTKFLFPEAFGAILSIVQTRLSAEKAFAPRNPEGKGHKG